MDDAARAIALGTLSKTFADKTFKTADKDAIEAEIDELYEAFVAATEASKRTQQYVSLYAPGATGIFLAYNASLDGSITLNGGMGTWKNLAKNETVTEAALNGSVTPFTGKDGKPYSTGWHISDHSIGYDLSWQKAGTTHDMSFTSELLGNRDNTTELVVFMDGMLIDNSSEPPLNDRYKPEKWGNLMMGKNYQMYFKHNKTYTGAETLLPATGTGDQLSIAVEEQNGTDGEEGDPAPTEPEEAPAEV
jgi:hypothetical protein